MNILDRITDSYDRKARLLPALLVVLPLGVLAVSAVPSIPAWWSRVLVLLVASGLPFVVVQIVRDRGWRVEPALFESWGGKPTTVMLRWAGPQPTTAVRRRHTLIAEHLRIQLPDVTTEQRNPAVADEAYEIATAALRERTRDVSRFPLVTKELIAYGFRRNSFACRWLALGACVVAATLTLVLARLDLISLNWIRQTVLIAFEGAWAAAWWFICTPMWVRASGERYARQLFASLEALEADRRHEIS